MRMPAFDSVLRDDDEVSAEESGGDWRIHLVVGGGAVVSTMFVKSGTLEFWAVFFAHHS